MRLARLARALRREPSPQGYCELVRGHLWLDEPEAAGRLLDEALARFPESPELRDLRSRLLARVLEERIREAQREAAARPGLRSGLALAEALAECDRIEQAEEVLREHLDRFGEDATLLLRIGELRARRYRRTLAAVDGRAALAAFERARDLDPEAPKPRLRLAEMFVRIGAVSRAREHLERLLADEPGLDPARRLLESLEPAEGAVEDVESCLADVEVSGVLRRLPWERERDPSEPVSDPATEGRRLSERPWCGEVWIRRDPDEEFVGGRPRGLAETASAMRAAFDRAARGMELGVPERLVVAGETAVLCLGFRPGASAAALVTDVAQVDRAQSEIDDALDRICGGGEAR